MEVEHLTLAEFLDAENRAACNGVDKPRFRTLLEKLEQLPRTRERLVFEILEQAQQCVEQKCEPVILATWIRSWSGVVTGEKLPELMALTESLIFNYFDHLPDIQFSEPILTLPILLNVIRRTSPSRVPTIIETLERKCGPPDLDPRSNIIAEIKRSL